MRSSDHTKSIKPTEAGGGLALLSWRESISRLLAGLGVDLGGSKANRRLAVLTLGALGVVYGDIGTSPLYALRQCFLFVTPTPAHVLGVLSLIFWSLALVISVKYMLFVLRADNDGEGGILALMALAARNSKSKSGLVGLGLFGAALLYGDGVITPAISVLGAMEGLHVITPALEHYVVPLSLIILVALFVFQRHGTGKVGAVFGPITIVWFVTIGILGLRQLVRAPHVLAAISPVYALDFLTQDLHVSLLVLGAVFLVVTGGEALYADMGHFGRLPIRLAWFTLVLPSLLLNYFGQGALLLADAAATRNPFFLLAPRWALWPLLALATLATVIASQAVISGAFSLAYQAVRLGYLPRLKIQYTSDVEKGQIYVPAINWALMIGVILLVITFRSSSNLAAAYGIAVTSTMLITTVLAYFVARRLWGWGPFPAGLVAGLFSMIDTAFLGANILKIDEGGWLPLLIASVVFILMSTWKRGREVLAQKLQRTAIPLDKAIPRLLELSERRVPGTAVYLISNPEIAPPALLHGTKHYKVLHERVVLLTFTVEDVPRVPPSRKIEITDLGHGFYQVRARFGFNETPLVRDVLRRCRAQGLEFEIGETTFFVGREALIAGNGEYLSSWRKRLFDWLSRNAHKASDSFELPAHRVVEIGVQVEL